MTLNGHFALKSVSGSATNGLASPAFYRLLIGNHTLVFSIGATFDDLEVHLKVISAQVVISTSISATFGMLSRRTVSQQ